MQYRTAVIAALAVAANASPFPQGVTSPLTPSAGAPPGCTPDYSGNFGIAVVNLTAPSGSPARVRRQASEISDGQIQPGSLTPAPTPISQIGDGQAQAPTAAAISQIGDGQAQAPTAAAISQIGDGQAQAPTPTPTSTPYVTSTMLSTMVSVASIASQISDYQVQAPTSVSFATSVATSITSYPASAASPSAAAASPSASDGSTTPVACSSDSTLTLQLADGKLTDSKGRTGYIAANYQFQFDEPPQAGSIYTTGWSVCGNGTLALGGSTTFYQCLSGNFYNLYDRDFGAGQCTPVQLSAVSLKSC